MTYLQRYFNARKTWMNAKRASKGLPHETYSQFENKVLSRLDPLGTGKTLKDFSRVEIKDAAGKILRTKVYMSEEEVIHRNVINQLKERKLYNKVYRLGGSTALNKQTFTTGPLSIVYNGTSYTANGKYSLGGVELIFWTPGNSLNPPLIQLGGVFYD